ncbi:hypothetical protein F5Y01DRAFT_321310 [Xylaria sp. FL0043]|nr:hypothetical protein F5Y01DRAFT_321310 [Xylaria sp. FL0043]
MSSRNMNKKPEDACYIETPVKDTEKRTEFFPLYCQVKAYPSMGGVVIGRFTAVQLKQLGLSNLKSAPRSHSNKEEDELALAIMRQGAHRWPSWKFHEFHRKRLAHTPYDFHFPPRINVGYPSSGNGVWVYKFSEDRMWFGEEGVVKPYLKRQPDGWYEHINMALNADERCEVLRSFGARFYETVDDCDDIPKTLEEGYEKGKAHELLLRKMEDEDYEDKWLEDCVLKDTSSNNF